MADVFRMPTIAGDGVELRRYEDLIFPNLDILDPEQGMKYAKCLTYKPGDILLCSYPKTGTHWLHNMVWKLKTLDVSKRSADTMLEYGQQEIFESMSTPRVIVTHLMPSRLPDEHMKNGGKIILILRNPKDAMVSYYHHMKDAALFKSKQTWNEFFHSYINGLIPLGSYFDYVQQWEEVLMENSTGKQVEVFYYEELKANLKENIKRLNTFLGFDRDERYIERVMNETTMAALREQDASGKRNTGVMSRTENGDSVIYRKGEVGGWKKYLTVAQNETVNKMIQERLKQRILKIKYEVSENSISGTVVTL